MAVEQLMSLSFKEEIFMLHYLLNPATVLDPAVLSALQMYDRQGLLERVSGVNNT